MPKITRDQVKVPVDVAPEARETYIDNYMAATRETGRLMLFACDQKVEHLNGDFYGEGIDPADSCRQAQIDAAMLGKIPGRLRRSGRPARSDRSLCG